MKPAWLFLGKVVLAMTIFPIQTCLAQQSNADQVYFAGSSFISNAADISERFPLISQAIKYGLSDTGTQPFEKKLRATVYSAKPHFFDIANKDGVTQGDYIKGSGKAVSFAFSHENVEIQELDNQFLSVYDISVQVLFFDFSPQSRQLLASYPVRLRFTDHTAARPTKEHQLQVVTLLLLNSDSETSIVNLWVRKMIGVAPKGGDKLVKVQPTEFSQKALALIPADVKKEVFAVEVAQFMESVISEEWNVPMVPVTEGNAIKGKMTQVFANGEAGEFDLPEPTFIVRTLVRDFKKVSEPFDGGDLIGYGAFITSSIDGPIGPISQIKIKNVESVTQPTLVKVKLDDWSQLKIVLNALVIKATKQVLATDRTWIKENSTTEDVIAQLDAIRSRVLKR